jgi:hypothetical protein
MLRRLWPSITALVRSTGRLKVRFQSFKVSVTIGPDCFRAFVVGEQVSLGGVILSGAAFQAEGRISTQRAVLLRGRSLTRLNFAGLRDDAPQKGLTLVPVAAFVQPSALN